ncbi:hypothetical protein [Nocardia sp. SYP-A9097]|nr:hypothetical protein [Nocardia sp. SYP-A9097]
MTAEALEPHGSAHYLVKAVTGAIVEKALAQKVLAVTESGQRRIQLRK